MRGHEGGQAPIPIGLLQLAAAARHSGAVHALTGAELNVNLVVLLAGTSAEAHVNDAVEVLIVVLAGTGYAEINDERHAMTVGDALVIPRGARRALGPTGARFAYLTCHQRRPPLAVAPRRGPAASR